MKTHFTTIERRIIYFSLKMKVTKSEIAGLLGRPPGVMDKIEDRRWFINLENLFGSLNILDIEKLRERSVDNFIQKNGRSGLVVNG